MIDLSQTEREEKPLSLAGGGGGGDDDDDDVVV